MKEISKDLKKVLDGQIIKAKKLEYVGDKVSGTGKDKVIKRQYTWKQKYDTWLLDPTHIYVIFKMTENNFEKFIFQSEDADLIDIWEDYKKMWKKVMMYDPDFSIMKKELGEFVHNIFDKTSSVKTDVILKKPDIDSTKLKAENTLLKRKLKYYEKQ